MPLPAPWSWLADCNKSLERVQEIKPKDQVGTLRVREHLGQPAQQMKAAIIRLNPGTLNPIAPAVMRIEPLPQAVVSEVHTTALLYFTNF
jgi:hypothetical protein